MKAFQQNADDGNHDGFLRFQWNQQQAVVLHAAAVQARIALQALHNLAAAAHLDAQQQAPVVVLTVNATRVAEGVTQALLDKNQHYKRALWAFHSSEVFNLLERSTSDPNGGMHYKRPTTRRLPGSSTPASRGPCRSKRSTTC